MLKQLSENELIVITQKAIRIRLFIIPAVIILLSFLRVIPWQDIFYIFAIVTFLTFLLFLTVKFKKGMFEVGLLSATAEIAILSWLFWFTGIEYYFFFTIFIFLIIAHTILESTIKGFYVAMIATIAYISLYFATKLTVDQPIRTIETLSLIVNIVSVYGIVFLVGKLSDELKNANRKLSLSAEKVFENMKEGLIVFDKDGRILRSNAAAKIVIESGKEFLEEVLEGQEKIIINPGAIYENRLSSVNDERIAVLRNVSPPWGVVSDKSNHEPINLAVVRIFGAELNKLRGTEITDADGRFSFTPSKGKYYLTVEKEGYRKSQTEAFEIKNPEEENLKKNIEMEKQ